MNVLYIYWHLCFTWPRNQPIVCMCCSWQAFDGRKNLQSCFRENGLIWRGIKIPLVANEHQLGDRTVCWAHRVLARLLFWPDLIKRNKWLAFHMRINVDNNNSNNNDNINNTLEGYCFPLLYQPYSLALYYALIISILVDCDLLNQDRRTRLLGRWTEGKWRVVQKLILRWFPRITF